jgi:hypothetical protein
MKIMNWLSASDFLAPANHYAALLFGLIFTAIMSTTLWIETKQKRILLVAVISGVVTTFAGVEVLKLIGFY